MTPGERKASLVAIIEECEEKNICGRAFMRAWMVWGAKSTQDAKTYVALMAPFADPGADTHFDLHAPRFYMLLKVMTDVELGWLWLKLMIQERLLILIAEGETSVEAVRSFCHAWKALFPTLHSHGQAFPVLMGAVEEVQDIVTYLLALLSEQLVANAGQLLEGGKTSARSLVKQGLQQSKWWSDLCLELQENQVATDSFGKEVQELQATLVNRKQGALSEARKKMGKLLDVLPRRMLSPVVAEMRAVAAEEWEALETEIKAATFMSENLEKRVRAWIAEMQCETLTELCSQAEKALKNKLSAQVDCAILANKETWMAEAMSRALCSWVSLGVEIPRITKPVKREKEREGRE